METLTVALGGKSYLATQVTRAEFRAICRLDTALRAASAADTAPTFNAVVDKLARIIRSSILRSGSRVSPEEADAWPPNDVLKTCGKLLNFIGDARLDSLSSAEAFPGSSKIQ